MPLDMVKKIDDKFWIIYFKFEGKNVKFAKKSSKSKISVTTQLLPWMILRRIDEKRSIIYCKFEKKTLNLL